MLDAVAMALKNIDAVQLHEMPRMADFAKWVVAAEPALPWNPGEILEAYKENRNHAHVLALEGSLIMPVLTEFVDGHQTPEWQGTAQELLEIFNRDLASDELKRQRGWPKSPKSLSNQLRRVAPNLRAQGIHVTFLPRSGRRRPIQIEKV